MPGQSRGRRSANHKGDDLGFGLAYCLAGACQPLGFAQHLVHLC